MNDPIRRLRTDARHLTHGRVPTAVRYPAAFQAAALALARPRLSRGLSIARVASELGLPAQALGRWLRRPPAAACPPRSSSVWRADLVTRSGMMDVSTPFRVLTG